MIIDTSYFLNKSVFIPNAVTQPSLGSNTPSSVDTLKAEIEEKESQLLLAALGYDQLLELKNQFEPDGTWKPTALQKWKDLVDGKDSWKGLRYTVGTKKVSLIAYYVYFYYLGQDFTTYTTTGVVISDSANSSIQTPNSKQAAAWNYFVRMYNGLNFGRNACNYAMFNNYNGMGIQFGIQNDLNEVSLYKFMSDNNDVYDVSKFKIETIINAYGL